MTKNVYLHNVMWMWQTGKQIKIIVQIKDNKQLENSQKINITYLNYIDISLCFGVSDLNSKNGAVYLTYFTWHNSPGYIKVHF